MSLLRGAEVGPQPNDGNIKLELGALFFAGTLKKRWVQKQTKRKPPIVGAPPILINLDNPQGRRTFAKSTGEDQSFLRRKGSPRQTGWSPNAAGRGSRRFNLCL